MQAFVIMPFAPGVTLYSAITEACNRAAIVPVRADTILAPGPIITQIFDAIAAADLVIANTCGGNMKSRFRHVRRAGSLSLTGRRMPCQAPSRRVLVAELSYLRTRHSVSSAESGSLIAFSRSVRKVVNFSASRAPPSGQLLH